MKRCKQYYRNNREKTLENQRKKRRIFREKNKERLEIEKNQRKEVRKKQSREKELIRGRNYYQNNKESCKKRSTNYNRRNKEKVKGYSKKCSQKFKKEHGISQTAFKRRSNLKFRVEHSLSNRIRAFLKGQKDRGIRRCLGLPLEEVISYLFPQGIPNYSYHIDHICPLSQATNTDETYKLNHYSNLRILPAQENLKKSDKKTPEGERLCQELLGRDWIEKKRLSNSNSLKDEPAFEVIVQK